MKTNEPRVKLFPRYCHIRIDYEINGFSEPPEGFSTGMAVATVTATNQIPDALREIADIMENELTQGDDSE